MLVYQRVLDVFMVGAQNEVGAGFHELRKAAGTNPVNQPSTSTYKCLIQEILWYIDITVPSGYLT
jgi:hypothetical protein